MGVRVRVVIVAVAVALALGLGLWMRRVLAENARARRELARAHENLTAATAALDTTRDAQGRAIAEVRRLRLTVGELEDARGALAARVRAMGVRLNRLTALSETRMRTIARLRGRVDTVYVARADSAAAPAVDTLRRLAYDDGHLTLEATVNESAGTYEARVESVDTLIQTVHRVRSGWWIFGCTKGIRQTVRSSNPHTRIVYQEYIEFER